MKKFTVTQEMKDEIEQLIENKLLDLIVNTYSMSEVDDISPQTESLGFIAVTEYLIAELRGYAERERSTLI